MSTDKKSGLSANWAVREVDHLFSRLSRYTSFVIYSKWSLAGVAVFLLVALLLWPMASEHSAGRISFVGTGEGAVTGKSSVSPTMDSPVYEGTDKNGQQYRITGARAVQATPELVVIEQVEGNIDTRNSFVSLTARQAEYAQKQQRITLLGNVHVTSGEGYDFTTPSALVNTETMEVTGEEEVRGAGPMGNLLATGFEIRDNGKTVRFGKTGRVNVNITKAQDPS